MSNGVDNKGMVSNYSPQPGDCCYVNCSVVFRVVEAVIPGEKTIRRVENIAPNTVAIVLRSPGEGLGATVVGNEAHWLLANVVEKWYGKNPLPQKKSFVEVFLTDAATQEQYVAIVHVNSLTLLKR